MIVEITTALIVLHAPGTNKEIEVNPQMVTSMRRGEKDGSSHFTEEAHCLVSLADGKYVAVKETCSEVRNLMEEVK
jgi:hypothetical protein